MNDDIKMGKFYWWNFRNANNVRVIAVKRDVHRPGFVYCDDDKGNRLCVEDSDLSEEAK